jgi:hypothetical protein
MPLRKSENDFLNMKTMSLLEIETWRSVLGPVQCSQPLDSSGVPRWVSRYRWATHRMTANLLSRPSIPSNGYSEHFALPSDLQLELMVRIVELYLHFPIHFTKWCLFKHWILLLLQFPNLKIIFYRYIYIYKSKAIPLTDRGGL